MDNATQWNSGKMAEASFREVFTLPRAPLGCIVNDLCLLPDVFSIGCIQTFKCQNVNNTFKMFVYVPLSSFTSLHLIMITCSCRNVARLFLSLIFISKCFPNSCVKSISLLAKPETKRIKQNEDKTKFLTG